MVFFDNIGEATLVALNTHCTYLEGVYSQNLTPHNIDKNQEANKESTWKLK